MSLLALMKGKGPSGFGYGSTAEEVTDGLDLKGRTMLVTGCNSGIGHETVRVLAARGVRVMATARTVEKARDACKGLEGETVPLACELCEPGSVRACVEAVKKEGAKLDAILCNAGIMAPPKLEQAFGYEKQFFTNHIGHFMLVTGLLDRLADDGRVVMTSSDAHNMTTQGGIEFDNLSGERDYNAWRAYGQSKLANILFVKELAKRLASTDKTANAVHPGVIATNLSRSSPIVVRAALKVAVPLFLKSEAQGAATQVFVATHPKAAGVSGEYFSDCNVGKSSHFSKDAELAARLWKESEKIVAALP
ncbi:MAG TPA: SDR family oxidoreductase [Polyangiaceae bacterium]|jgi:NAD(P)-dependent dehydrogenase (short-subunit alcohol dehydrogenase family)|nr:SDR family oxidoreductase [Polyangiaceae bacterium]